MHLFCFCIALDLAKKNHFRIFSMDPQQKCHRWTINNISPYLEPLVEPWFNMFCSGKPVWHMIIFYRVQLWYPHSSQGGSSQIMVISQLANPPEDLKMDPHLCMPLTLFFESFFPLMIFSSSLLVPFFMPLPSEPPRRNISMVCCPISYWTHNDADFLQGDPKKKV